MKKIINNKKYDTETAKYIGSYDNELDRFDRVEQYLYRKKTGEYFLHSEGGPMTRFARPMGDGNWKSGQMIEPLSYEDARSWAEEHLDPDKYEAEFGEVQEDDSAVVLSISLEASLAEQLRREAREAGISVSELITRRLGK